MIKLMMLALTERVEFHLLLDKRIAQDEIRDIVQAAHQLR